MKVKIFDVRVGIKGESPLKRAVTLTARLDEEGDTFSDFRLTLTEQNAREVHRWIGRCLEDLDRGGVDMTRIEADAPPLPIEDKQPGKK